MINNKYNIPILIIIGLVLFNIYAYFRVEDNLVIPILFASISMGVYKGIIADEFKEVFNLHHIKGIFKGSMRVLELIVAFLITTSTNHVSYKLFSVMSFSDIMLEVVYDVVFLLIIYRFLILNLFKNKPEVKLQE